MSNSSHPPELGDSEQAKTEVHSPIDFFLSLPPERDVSGAELLDVLAGVINQFRRNQPELWEMFLKDAQRCFVKWQVCPQETFSMSLEQTYQELTYSLIEVRQAVAIAIATEKHLEGQLKRNQAEYDTWAERARVAMAENNPELAKQAKDRGLLYIKANETISEQLDQQRLSTRILRQRLRDLESSVQKAYVQKNSMVARETAALAHIKADQLIDLLNITLKEAHSAVLELEDKIKPTRDFAQGIEIDSNALLAEVSRTLERATNVLTVLEERFLDEAPQSSRNEHSDSGACKNET